MLVPPPPPVAELAKGAQHFTPPLTTAQAWAELEDTDVDAAPSTAAGDSPNACKTAVSATTNPKSRFDILSSHH
jgi:hypothetical protein